MVSDFFTNFWTLTAEMAPYLLLGFFCAGLLSVFLSRSFIERVMGKPGIGSVIKATLVGVPMPLCSCGVIPMAASLRKMGASRGATTAFVSSTPQTGVDSIIASWGMLGPLFAVFRILAAFFSGIVSGQLVDFFVKGRDEGDATINVGHAPRKSKGLKAGEMFRYGFVTIPKDIAKSLLIGLVIAGVLGALLPSDFFLQYLGTGLLAKVVMTIASVPFYVCSTGSIPLALVFIDSGLSLGAAFIFLVAGPATNAATITTLWKMIGPKALGIYIGVIIGSAWLFGWLIDRLPHADIAAMAGHEHLREVALWQHLSAILLILILGYALWNEYTSRNYLSVANRGCVAEGVAVSQRVLLRIEGMTCPNCAQKVLNNLKGVDKVAQVDIDLKTGLAEITGGDFDPSSLKQVVEELGYAIKSPPEVHLVP